MRSCATRTKSTVAPGAAIKIGKTLNQLTLPEGESRFVLRVAEAGHYAFFTEHHPDEFQATLLGSNGDQVALGTREYKPDHEHDDEVSSVGITTPGDLHSKKFNAWLGELLQEKGADIFRMKGVLSIKGESKRFVFQGVHMLFDGQPDREWGTDERHNSLIFIGRNLDREELNAGFRACLV